MQKSSFYPKLPSNFCKRRGFNPERHHHIEMVFTPLNLSITVFTYPNTHKILFLIDGTKKVFI